MILISGYSYSETMKVLLDLKIEERAMGITKEKIWKNFTFVLPYDSKVKITAIATAYDNGSRDDDDMKWGIDKEDFGWATDKAWDGRETAGVKKEIVVERSLLAGSHNIYFWADQNPILHSLKIEIEDKVEITPPEISVYEYINGVGVKLEWNKLDGVKGYAIFRESSKEKYKKLAEVAVPMFLDAFVEPGENYKYNLGVVTKEDKIIAYSKEVQIRTLNIKPLAIPSELKYEITNGKVQIRWNKNEEDNFSKYAIYRKSEDARYIKIKEVDIPQYLDESTEISKIYKYRITALSKEGTETEMSTELEVKVEQNAHNPTGVVDVFPKEFYAGDTVTVYFSDKRSKELRRNRDLHKRRNKNLNMPPRPTKMKVKYGFNGWNAEYTIDESQAPEMEYVESMEYWKIELKIPTFAQDLDMMFMDEYGNEDKNWSKDYIFPVAKDKIPPKPPKNLVVETRNRLVYIEWDPSDDMDISYFEVLRSDDPKFGFNNPGALLATELKERKYKDLTVQPNKKYYYRIRAYDFSGNRGEVSEPIEATAPVTGVIINSICSWTPSFPSVGDNLKIYYSTEKGGFKNASSLVAKIGINDWSQLADFAGISGNKEMKFDKVLGAWYTEIKIPANVKNVNIAFTDGIYWDNNNEKNWNIDIRPDTTPPGIVKDFNIIPKGKSVVLEWSQSEDEDANGYNIYRNGKKISTFLIKETKYEDSGLEEGLEYEYSVSAVDMAGNEGEKTLLKVKTLKDIITTPNILYTTSLKMGTPLRLIASIETIAKWQIDILNNESEIVNSFEGRADNIMVTWNLTDAKGVKVRPGTYKYRVSVIDIPGILPREVSIQIDE